MIESLFLIALCLFLLLLLSKGLPNYFYVVISVSFMLRLSLCYVHQYIQPLGASADEKVFELKGYLWSTDGLTSALSSFDPSTSYVFSTLIAVIYSIFGRNIFLVQVLGAFIGTLMVIIAYRFAIRVFYKRSKALMISLLVAFWPSILIINSLVLRDIYIITFLSLFFYNFYTYLETKQIKYFTYSLLSLSITGMFHGIFLLFIPFILAYLIFLTVRQIRIRRDMIVVRKTSLVVLILIPLIFSIIVGAIVSGVGQSKITQVSRLIEGNERALEIFSGEVIKTKAITESYPKPSSFTLSGVLFHIPERWLYFMFKPSVTSYSKVTDIYRILDSFLFIITVLLILRRAKVVLSDSAIKSIILILFGLTLVFCLGTFDVVSGARHRIKFLLPMIILLFYTLEFKTVAQRLTNKSQ